MTHRHEYFLRLDGLVEHLETPAAIDLYLRPPELADKDALARLMIDAYQGTIDYDGETLEDAVGEMTAYLSGEQGGRAMLQDSRVAFARDELLGACLVAMWQARDLPLIAYAMTGARWKGTGVARRLLWEVVRALRDQGYREVRAVITEGNVPSERLFGRIGFEKVPR